MLEAQYQHDFKVISDQILGATRAFYTYMEINKFASENNHNHQKIAQNGHFWNGQLYALQTTWFIVLGRIFDPTRDAYSLNDFLKSTVAHKGLFSKNALAGRKRLSAGQAQPEWLDDYLKSAWEPSTSDLEKIRAIGDASDAKWKAIYKPIRDKIFAHTDPNVTAESLFQGTLIGDIEDILHDLNKIRLFIFQLVENGREYWIENDDRRYTHLFVEDVRKVLARLCLPDGSESW